MVAGDEVRDVVSPTTTTFIATSPSEVNGREMDPDGAARPSIDLEFTLGFCPKTSALALVSPAEPLAHLESLGFNHFSD
jgi:hypothetical protein